MCDDGGIVEVDWSVEMLVSRELAARAAKQENWRTVDHDDKWAQHDITSESQRKEKHTSLWNWENNERIATQLRR